MQFSSSRTLRAIVLQQLFIAAAVTCSGFVGVVAVQEIVHQSEVRRRSRGGMCTVTTFNRKYRSLRKVPVRYATPGRGSLPDHPHVTRAGHCSPPAAPLFLQHAQSLPASPTAIRRFRPGMLPHSLLKQPISISSRREAPFSYPNISLSITLAQRAAVHRRTALRHHAAKMDRPTTSSFPVPLSRNQHRRPRILSRKSSATLHPTTCDDPSGFFRVTRSRRKQSHYQPHFLLMR